MGVAQASYKPSEASCIYVMIGLPGSRSTETSLGTTETIFVCVHRGPQDVMHRLDSACIAQATSMAS